MMPFSDSGLIEVSVLSMACSGRTYRFRIFVFPLQICHCVSCVSHREKTNILPSIYQFSSFTSNYLFFMMMLVIASIIIAHIKGFIIIRAYLTHTT